MAGSASRKAAVYYVKRYFKRCSDPIITSEEDKLFDLVTLARHAAAYWGYAKHFIWKDLFNRIADETAIKAKRMERERYAKKDPKKEN